MKLPEAKEGGAVVASLPILPLRRAPMPDGDRLPPQNLEAERSVLGSILIDGSRIKEVRNILYVPHFYRDAHQVIYQAILDLDDDGKPIDVITVSAQLQLRDQLEDLINDDHLESIIGTVPHAANAKYYAELIREKAASRAVIDHAKQLLDDAYSSCFTADELIGEFTKKATILQHAHADGRDEDESSFTPLPGGMAPAAFRGVAGKLVGIIADNTEACREAILMQLLVAFGNAIGDRAHWIESGKKHRCNLFLCIVGPTGCGKGMAWDAVQWLMGRCNQTWTAKPLLESMTSGEGVIKEIKELGGPVLAVEAEFGQVLGNMARDGNSLSSVLRKAWESSYLRNPTKNNAVSVQNAYLSMVGHITPDELKQKLRATDINNGLVNRFMWAGAYLARYLSRGGDFDSLQDALSPYLEYLLFSSDYGLSDKRMDQPFCRDPEAEALWDSRYKGLRLRPPGPYGMATARGAPNVMRMAVIYAILDRDSAIRKSHLESALACWDYCDQTAKSIFGNAPVDQEGDKVMTVLREDHSKGGLSRTEINRKAFFGRKQPEALDAILGGLNHAGLIRMKAVNTRGKECMQWVAI